MWELVAGGNTITQVRKKLELRKIYLDRDTISKIIQEAIEEPGIPFDLVRTQKQIVQEWILSKRPNLAPKLAKAAQPAPSEEEARTRLVELLKVQLPTPEPELLFTIRDLGGPGTRHHRLGGATDDILWHGHGYGGVRTTSASATWAPGTGAEMEVWWRVGTDGSVKLSCPVQADPSLRPLLTSLGWAVQKGLADWAREGGMYLVACCRLLSDIHEDSRNKTGAVLADPLRRIKFPFLPALPQPLTPHFGDLVYQLAVQHRRGPASLRLPDAEDYQVQARTGDPLFWDLFLGLARIHLATAPPGILLKWAEIHRQMVRDWAQSKAVDRLCQSFGRLRGFEDTAKRDLARRPHN